MQLKDGSSLAVVSGCPSRGNGHTGVKGKAHPGSASLTMLGGHVVVLNAICCGTLILCDATPAFASNFGSKYGLVTCLLYDTTLMIHTSQSPQPMSFQQQARY